MAIAGLYTFGMEISFGDGTKMPVTRLIECDYGIESAARMQDQERAIREDDAYFKTTGINRLTVTTPPDVSDTDVVVVNGVRVTPNSLAYQRWYEREDSIKQKAFRKLVKKVTAEYYDNAISALKL